MNEIQRRIVLDVNKRDGGPELIAKRGDTVRSVAITLKAGASVYKIEEGCYAALTAQQSGVSVPAYIQCDIQNDTILCPLDELTGLVGRVKCEVKLYSQEGELLTSPMFTLRVADTIYQDGDDVAFPAPVSRVIMAPTEAKVGQLIVVKAVDENGTPTQWEAVDRTHWVEGGGYVLEEITLTASEDTDGMMIIPGYVPLENGKVYTVNYNGVAYECQAMELTVDDMTGIYLGNLSALTGTGNTGEPFVMMALPSKEVVAEAGYGGIVADVTGATTATISIGGETVHKLDNKFLDLEWLPTKEDVFAEMIPETAFEGGKESYSIDDTAISEYFLPQLTEVGMEIEGRVSVIYDGAAYDCAYVVGRDETDRFFSINFPSTAALPFCVFSFLHGTATVCFLNADGTFNTDPHTLSMSIYEGEKYNTIPVEFLPEDVAQIGMLAKADMLPAVHDADGKILTDENGNVILRY